MKVELMPEVCTGMYYPLRGKPRRGYYVVVDEVVLAGPFARKCDANEKLQGVFSQSTKPVMSRAISSKQLSLKFLRSVKSVLHDQVERMVLVHRFRA